MILDSYVLIEAFTAEHRDDIAGILLSREALISSINLAEVIDVTTRVFRQQGERVEDRIDTLLRLGALEVIVVDDRLARRAGILRAKHYDKRVRSVSLADCVAAAAAESLGEAIATPDPHLQDLTRQIGLEVIPL